MSAYAEAGEDVSSLVAKQIDRAAQEGRTLDTEAALEEFVADSMEKMLADGEVIKALARENPTLLQEIKSFLADLVKRLTAAYAGIDPDSEEGRIVAGMTDRVKKLQAMYAEALSDAGKNYRGDGRAAKSQQNAKNAAKSQREGKLQARRTAEENYKDYDKPITAADVAVLRSIGRKSVNDFTAEDIQKAQKWAYKFYKELGTKSPFFRAWFGDWRTSSNVRVSTADIPAYVDSNEFRRGNRGTFENADTGWDVAVSREGETNTISHSGDRKMSEYGLAGIKALVENAVLLDTEVHEHHKNNTKNDNIVFDHKLYALGDGHDGTGLYKITVEEYFQSKSEPNKKRFHNLKYIEKVADIPADALSSETRSGGSTMGSPTTKYSISDLYSLVKTYDKEFHAGEEVNPALLNEDGTPKVFYHGTDAEFTVFDPERFNTREPSGDYVGEGFFFSTDKNTARKYGKNVMPVYLRINNPLVIESPQDAKNFRNTFLGKYAEGDQELRDLLGGDYDYFSIMEENPSAIREELQKKGYDGLIDKMYGQAAVFSPEQIKSATNNIGTFDRSESDIRYQTRRRADRNNPASRAESLNMDMSDPRNVSRIENEVTKVLDGTMPSNQLVLIGRPSTILSEYLGSERPLYMPQSAIKKAILPKGEKGGKHGLGRVVIDELAYHLADPMAITGNTSAHETKGDNSVIVWTDWMTESGDSVVVPIRIDVDGSIGVYNNINTMFDAYDPDYVSDLLRDNNVLYTRKNRSIDELLTQRREVPKWESANASTKDNTTSRGESQEENKNSLRRKSDQRSEREILSTALLETAANEGEREALVRYQRDAAKYDELDAHLADVKAQIKELSFAPGKRDTAKLAA